MSEIDHVFSQCSWFWWWNKKIWTYSCPWLSKVIYLGVSCQSKAHMQLPISQ